MPCSVNFFKYLKNYDKFLDENSDAIKNSDPSQSTLSMMNNVIQNVEGNTGPQYEVRQIKSPKHKLCLEPLQKFMAKH